VGQCWYFLNKCYIYKLTATLARKDGHHPIVLMQCGPVRYMVNAKIEPEKRPFKHVLIPRPTDFKMPDARVNAPIHEYFEELITDELL
jgi:hypothetical protein